MAANSKIEWTQATWNPVTGCTKVSAGCTHCYAELLSKRLHAIGLTKYRNEFTVTTHPNVLDVPTRWRSPKIVFVNSMSDLFHKDIPDDFIDRVFRVMRRCPQHIFQILTKRAERMAEYSAFLCSNDVLRMERIGEGSPVDNWPLPNVWLGTSVEDQPTADDRLPQLFLASAAVRFVSAEPLLAFIEMERWFPIAWQCSGCETYFADPFQEVCPICEAHGYWSGSHKFNPPGGQRATGIDWVIAGGESGPKARPMQGAWIRHLRSQCSCAQVPFFFKQWGGRNKRKAGRVLDGRTWDEMPRVALDSAQRTR